LAGDDNPLHLDAAYAATTPFRSPIVHGLLVSALIPTLFGATVPGAVYVSQALRFRRPVYLDERVVARVTVTAVAPRPRGGGHLVTCATTVTRHTEEGGAGGGEGGGGKPWVYIDGEAVVILPGPDAAAGGGGGGGAGGSDAAPQLR
jgi:acyl dehydratase